MNLMKKKKESNWWIRISTRNPGYIYYFGSFDSYWEAKDYKLGYIEDLEKEETRIVNIEIKQCKPQKLTISLDS